MMFTKLTLLAAFAVSSLEAFSVSNPTVRTQGMVAHNAPLFMSDMTDDFPSDSSTEEIVDVVSETVEPTATDVVVTSILDDLPDEGKPITSISKETRASINEALLKLETMNPTEDPASSPLLNGVWSLRYAGGYDEDWALPSPTRQIALFLYSGGYSPGLFALSLASSLPAGLVEVGDLEISISREQPRIEASIDVKFLGGASNDVVVKARLSEASDIRLTETYESASVLGQTIDLPEAVQYSRDLYIAYLDEDVLVVRDGSGVPEILVRKQ
mmetsp:Transcript_15303/g.22426  ORF Transcript_15303/g.22426 Transcript_15303/m.22426 type:complete len:272 (-) Transcript_15303:199-1014(-)